MDNDQAILDQIEKIRRKYLEGLDNINKLYKIAALRKLWPEAVPWKGDRSTVGTAWIYKYGTWEYHMTCEGQTRVFKLEEVPDVLCGPDQGRDSGSPCRQSRNLL